VRQVQLALPAEVGTTHKLSMAHLFGDKGWQGMPVLKKCAPEDVSPECLQPKLATCSVDIHSNVLE
jgi:hypothetical protein